MGDKNTAQSVVKAFEDLAMFVKTRWRATILGSLFLIFVAVSCLLTFWVYKQIEMLNENAYAVKGIVSRANPTPEKMQELLEKTNNQNILIDTVLRKDVLSKVGDRAFLLRFHNGSRDINGTHFMYMSVSNEVTVDGISNEAPNFQAKPTSLMETSWITSLLDNKCVDVSPPLLGNIPMKSILLSMGIKRIKVCPVTSIETGNLLGLIGVSWVAAMPDVEECLHADGLLREANHKLSAILSVE